MAGFDGLGGSRSQGGFGGRGREDGGDTKDFGKSIGPTPDKFGTGMSPGQASAIFGNQLGPQLAGYKNNKFYNKGQDKLIKNYGIGAQIIKALNIKNMILVTRSRKKVVGLEGYGIKITKQEIIK